MELGPGGGGLTYYGVGQWSISAMARFLVYILYGLALCFVIRALLEAQHALAAFSRAPAGSAEVPNWFELLLPNPTLLFEIAVLAALAEALRVLAVKAVR